MQLTLLRYCNNEPENDDYPTLWDKSKGEKNSFIFALVQNEKAALVKY